MSKRCIYCGAVAVHPLLPLCMPCDVVRLNRGVNAAQVIEIEQDYAKRGVRICAYCGCRSDGAPQDCPRCDRPLGAAS